MRHLVTSVLFLGLTLFYAHAEALGALTFSVVDARMGTTGRVIRERATCGLSTWRVAQNAGTELSHPIADKADRDRSPIATNVSDLVCQTLETATLLNDLPLEFLTRLIWQESRFDPRAVSPAGAQGVAQFMPETAAWVGLANPFDEVEAITKSAELLRNLKTQFGNLGLAAAAYNAGPKRVQDWLAGRGNLPEETQAYVRIVTGHAANEWKTDDPTRLGLNLPDAVPCPQIAKLLADHRPERSKTLVVQDKLRPMEVSGVPEAAWGVQLIGNSSEISALASYHQLQKTYKAALGTRVPLVIRSKVGVSAYWYRVRIGFDSRRNAEELCSSLRAIGGSCLVQRNRESADGAVGLESGRR